MIVLNETGSFVLFRPSLLSGLVAFTTANFSENDPSSPSLLIGVFSGSGCRCCLLPAFLAACSSIKHWHGNGMFSKSEALMSSSLPHWDFLVILLICPFMTSVTKIATRIYPKGRDDSLGNFFWISNWLAVVFTSWINSLGSWLLCTAFFYFRGKVPLFCRLPQLFLVCRFHIFF